MKNIIELMKQIIDLIRKILKDPIGRIGFIGIVLIIIISIMAPYIANHSITEMYTKHKLEAPNDEFLFGTDNFGRDVFSRIIYGGEYR